MRKRWFCTALCLVLLGCGLFSGCKKAGISNPTETAPPTTAAPAAVDPGQVYLSFTVTHNGMVKGTFTSDVYYVDLKTRNPKRVASVPYTAQYPLTAYDKSANLVYYSSKNEAKNGDELFSFNLKTKETRQLTQGLFAINYIIPLGGSRVFLGAVPRDAKVLAIRPYLYHTDTGVLEDKTWDEDLHFNKIAYNPLTQTLAGAGFSSSEHQRKLENAQPNVPVEDCENHVFLLKDGGQEREELFTVPDNVRSLYPTADHLYSIAIAGDYSKYDFQSGKTALYPLFEKLPGFETFLYFSPGEEEIYYLRGYTLTCYHTKTGQLEDLYAVGGEEEAALNNAVALHE